jgi:hypothetical protein
MTLKKKKEVKMDSMCPIFQKVGMDALLLDLDSRVAALQAGNLGEGSVDTIEIKDGAVTLSKLATGVLSQLHTHTDKEALDNIILALSVDTETGYVTNVNDLVQSGNVRMDQGMVLFKNRSTGLYDEVIKYESDNTLTLGGVNSNGVSLLNNKYYKVENTFGDPIHIAGVDTSNNMIFGDYSANRIKFKFGGMDEGTYGLELINQGDILVKKAIHIGSEVHTVVGGELDITDVQTDANSGTAGIGLASYRNTDIWGSFVYGIRYRGSQETPAACQAEDVMMEVGCLGFDGSNVNGGGELMWVVDGVVESGKIPTRAELYVTKSDGTTSLGMKIDKSLKAHFYGDIQLAGDITDGTNSANLEDIKSAVDTKYKSLGTCTLSNGLTSTVVLDSNIASSSKIFLQATSATASASAAYISAIVDGTSFTITHAVSDGSETFNYISF